MTGADRYSRIVLWLKVGLPLVALAILSTLFFVAETLDPEAAIPYAKVDVERILREQGVTRPSFGGTTPDGATIFLTAASVRPGGEERTRLTALDMSATLNFPEGGQVDIDSPTGIVDNARDMAILDGGARLETSTGYVVHTERAVAMLADATVVADSTITATGPAGDITAGHMKLTRADDATYVLVFTEGVRLIYRPNP